MSSKPIKRLTAAQINAGVEAAELEYVTALGRVAHSWNHLHEALGSLFAFVLSKPIKTVAPIWYSTNNDRAQREMLRAAIAKSEVLNDSQRKDIIWLLNATDRLANQRNSAIHAPCSFAIHEPTQTIVLHAHFYHGNPRADDLLGKDILKEFAWYRARSETLKQFSHGIGASLNVYSRRPWPERPKLPELGQS